MRLVSCPDRFLNAPDLRASTRVMVVAKSTPFQSLSKVDAMIISMETSQILLIVFGTAAS